MHANPVPDPDDEGDDVPDVEPQDFHWVDWRTTLAYWYYEAPNRGGWLSTTIGHA